MTIPFPHYSCIRAYCVSDGSDCRIFLAVLQGEVSEEIWADQAALLDEILVEVRKEPLAHQASPTPLPPSRSPPRLSLPHTLPHASPSPRCARSRG
jgi:hypothetical protein